MQKSRSSLTKLLICAMLCALSVVLGTYFAIPMPIMSANSFKLSLAMIPIFIASILYGPIYGMVSGFSAELIKILLIAGDYPFLITAALTGLIPGLFFIKSNKLSLLKLSASIAATQIICSVFLNTFLISFLYGTPIKVLLPLRAINQAVHIPVFIFITNLLLKSKIR